MGEKAVCISMVVEREGKLMFFSFFDMKDDINVHVIIFESMCHVR